MVTCEPSPRVKATADSNPAPVRTLLGSPITSARLYWSSGSAISSHSRYPSAQVASGHTSVTGGLAWAVPVLSNMAAQTVMPPKIDFSMTKIPRCLRLRLAPMGRQLCRCPARGPLMYRMEHRGCRRDTENFWEIQV
jgi:hypothetical protein